MALILPVLFLLLLGVADFGRLFHSYIAVRNASREGARFASHFPELPDDIRAAVRLEASHAGVSLADSAIGIDPDADDGIPILAGNPITVSVAYQFDTIMGGLVGMEVITVTAATEMVVFGHDS
jgi:hypothetical protein